MRGRAVPEPFCPPERNPIAAWRSKRAGILILERYPCPAQSARGHTEIYRGAEYTVDLIPKIRVEVLCDDADAETLVDVIIKSAGSGTIGDGKVWVAPLDMVARVRTGETGSAAI